MFQRKPRRFRRRTNGRNNMTNNNNGQSRLRSNSFQNGQRNNFRQTLSPEKLFEKYTSLAKEAMSSGDKTLSENYLQHADHFMRIIEDRNKIRNQSKVEEADNSDENQKKLSDSNKKDPVKENNS